MFRLTQTSIVPAAITHPHPDAGGIVTFEGRVRAVNDGKRVTSLEYEAYATLCESEGASILAEALTKFSLYHAAAVHRVGHLAIGDIAVWIHTSAMHRREAFLGTEYIIREIKHRLPIWKKEHYADGAAEWVRCTHRHDET